jgi:AcrR family transcriptional regulator
MESQSSDRRVRRTRRLLKQGLAELMLEKEFREITVKDITERVDLNRGTFYLHYTDTYDLLYKVETEVLSDLQDMIDEWIRVQPQEENQGLSLLFRPLLDYVSENADLCQALLKNNASSGFLTRLEEWIYKNGYAVINKWYPAADPTTCDYYFSFISYGMIGTLRRWFEEDKRLPPDELVRIIEKNLTAAAEKLLGESA